MTRPPLPPFDDASARIKVRLAEDAWNSREPERVSLAYTPDSRWRNRAEIFEGRERISEDAEIVDLLNGADGPRAERGIVIRIVAFDCNCPKNIPIRLTDAEREEEIARLCNRIASLEREFARKTSPSAN